MKEGYFKIGAVAIISGLLLLCAGAISWSANKFDPILGKLRQDDATDVSSITTDVAAIEGRTNVWEKGATDGVSATTDVAVALSQTGEYARVDGSILWTATWDANAQLLGNVARIGLGGQATPDAGFGFHSLLAWRIEQADGGSESRYYNIRRGVGDALSLYTKSDGAGNVIWINAQIGSTRIFTLTKTAHDWEAHDMINMGSGEFWGTLKVNDTNVMQVLTDIDLTNDIETARTDAQATSITGLQSGNGSNVLAISSLKTNVTTVFTFNPTNNMIIPFELSRNATFKEIRAQVGDGTVAFDVRLKFWAIKPEDATTINAAIVAVTGGVTDTTFDFTGYTNKYEVMLVLTNVSNQTITNWFKTTLETVDDL